MNNHLNRDAGRADLTPSGILLVRHLNAPDAIPVFSPAGELIDLIMPPSSPISLAELLELPFGYDPQPEEPA